MSANIFGRRLKPQEEKTVSPSTSVLSLPSSQKKLSPSNLSNQMPCYHVKDTLFQFNSFDLLARFNASSAKAPVLPECFRPVCASIPPQLPYKETYNLDEFYELQVYFCDLITKVFLACDDELPSRTNVILSIDNTKREFLKLYQACIAATYFRRFYNLEYTSFHTCNPDIYLPAMCALAVRSSHYPLWDLKNTYRVSEFTKVYSKLVSRVADDAAYTSNFRNAEKNILFAFSFEFDLHDIPFNSVEGMLGHFFDITFLDADLDWKNKMEALFSTVKFKKCTNSSAELRSILISWARLFAYELAIYSDSHLVYSLTQITIMCCILSLRAVVTELASDVTDFIRKTIAKIVGTSVINYCKMLFEDSDTELYDIITASSTPSRIYFSKLGLTPLTEMMNNYPFYADFSTIKACLQLELPSYMSG